MEVKLIATEDSNGDLVHEICVDGESHLELTPLWENPEDAKLTRDMFNGHDLIEWIKKSYEAGKRGEQLHITYDNSRLK